MNKLEIRQELEKLAKKLVATDMGSPVGDGAQLQALWILHQLCDDPDAQGSDSGIFSETFEAVREAYQQSMHIIHELRQQILDKDQLIYSMSERLTGVISEILNESPDRMISILAEATEYDGEEPWSIEDVSWNGVHSCACRAPKFISIGSKKLSEIDIEESYREWARIDRDGKISLSGEEVATGLEFIDGSTAAVYRFCEHELAEKRLVWEARLVWERRFMYMAQMTREQQLKLEKKEK